MAAIIPFIRPDAPASAPAAHGRASVLRFPAPAIAPSPAPAPAPAASTPALPLPDVKIEDQRKAMLAKIHIALGKLSRLPGFSDDVYRFTLQERWGVDSSAAMSIRQLDEVLHWLAELGFQSSHPFYARRDYNRHGTAALIEKINALLAEKGQEKGKFLGMEYAEGILKRQTRGEVESVYKATPKQLRGVIAALDKDASRKGRRRA